ncbi:MAG: ROK family glucokinase [Tenericutes bacterium]|nr:ROK family glucokinase [Mycoplasmatota bacterium]
MRNYIIGIDIGGTSIKFGKFDLEGNLLDKWTIPTNKENLGESILTDIARSISENQALNTIKGIGFGVPGPVKHDVVISCVNLGWGRKHIVDEFKAIINDPEIKVKAANDATIAAAGEMYKGIARGYKNVALFTIGTGVGGGIIVNKALVEGVNGVGGELGHIPVDFKHNFKCNCGNLGCLETVASATGIINIAKENLRKSKAKSLLRRFNTFSAKKVIDYAKEGDFIAKKSLEESMRYLAQAMAAITYTIDPEIIVIGGGVSNAGPYIIELIEKYYYEMVKPFITQANFAIATLGNEAGIYGCCYLVK